MSAKPCTKRDGAPRVRVSIHQIAPWRCEDPSKWRGYVARMRAGDNFPPVSVIRQRGRFRYRLSDGYHRTRAAKRIGRKTIQAVVIVDETNVTARRRAARRNSMRPRP